MNLVVCTFKRTGIQKIPGDDSICIYYVDEETQLRVTGITKIGIERVYNVQGGGYIPISNVRVLRDMEFYYDNKLKKNNYLMKNNISTVGGHGVGELIGRTESLTENWFDLNRHGGLDLLGSFVKGMTGNKGSANKQAQQQQSLPSGINGGCFGGGTNSKSAGQSTNSGGLIPTKGTTVPSAQTKTYSNNMLNMKVSDVFGGGKDSTMSKLFGDIKFGSMTDGTFLNNLLGNAMGMLGSWFGSKLNFVVGFDITAALSGLFNAFGTNWDGLIKIGMNNLLGLNGTSVLNSVNTNRGLTQYNNSNSVTSWSGYGVKFFDVKAGEGDRYTFKYAEVTQQMKDYFKYKGCNGEMITKTYAGLTWTQDKTYATTVMNPTRDQEEIKIWKNIYNATYSELNDSVDAIKEEFNLKVERKTLFVNFNRYRVPVPDHELNASRGYVFFTRPDLNLQMDVKLETRDANAQDGQLNLGQQNQQTDANGNVQANAITKRTAAYARFYPLMVNIMKSHSVLASYLMGDSAGVSHKFVPILSHACTGIDVQDEVLETTETGETYTGWKYIYGTSLIKSKTAGTVTVTFTDDDMLSIYKYIKVWCEYISAVYRGEAGPKEKYIKTHQLDYAISIYYFLCKATESSDILFWTKYTGCFPTAIPSSNFSDSIGNPIKRPSYSVPFAYARKDDYNPIHIVGFNQLGDENFQYMPNYNQKTLHTNKSFVGAPFIDTNNGSQLFKLKFRPN